MIFLLQSILVFILMAATDLVWAISIKSISDDKLVRGGIFAALLVILNGIAIVSYVKEPWLIIPSAVGAFTGVILSKYIKR